MVKERNVFIIRRIHKRNLNENFYNRDDHKNLLNPQANAPKAPIIVKNRSSILYFAKVL